MVTKASMEPWGTPFVNSAHEPRNDKDNDNDNDNDNDDNNDNNNNNHNNEMIMIKVYKRGDLDFEGNYRPISVTGHIARLVESLMCSQIIHYPESHDLIPRDQSAYLKRYSTQNSSHRVIVDWLQNINEVELTGACLLDISKCFDSINHDILQKKLEMCGFQDIELTWFKTYIHNRQQLVSFQQETSEYLDIKNGVPQR